MPKRLPNNHFNDKHKQSSRPSKITSFIGPHHPPLHRKMFGIRKVQMPVEASLKQPAKPPAPRATSASSTPTPTPTTSQPPPPTTTTTTTSKKPRPKSTAPTTSNPPITHSSTPKVTKPSTSSSPPSSIPTSYSINYTTPLPNSSSNTLSSASSSIGDPSTGLPLSSPSSPSAVGPVVGSIAGVAAVSALIIFLVRRKLIKRRALKKYMTSFSDPVEKNNQNAGAAGADRVQSSIYSSGNNTWVDKEAEAGAVPLISSVENVGAGAKIAKRYSHRRLSPPPNFVSKMQYQSFHFGDDFSAGAGFTRHTQNSTHSLPDYSSPRPSHQRPQYVHPASPTIDPYYRKNVPYSPQRLLHNLPHGAYGYSPQGGYANIAPGGYQYNRWQQQQQQQQQYYQHPQQHQYQQNVGYLADYGSPTVGYMDPVYNSHVAYNSYVQSSDSGSDRPSQLAAASVQNNSTVSEVDENDTTSTVGMAFSGEPDERSLLPRTQQPSPPTTAAQQQQQQPAAGSFHPDNINKSTSILSTRTFGETGHNPTNLTSPVDSDIDSSNRGGNRRESGIDPYVGIVFDPQPVSTRNMSMEQLTGGENGEEYDEGPKSTIEKALVPALPALPVMEESDGRISGLDFENRVSIP